MPVLYKLITAILAMTGCFSLLITGEIDLLFYVGVFAIIPGYYRLLKEKEQAPGWAIGMFSVCALLVFLIDAISLSADVFLAVAHLTILFQGIKSFDLKEPWDHLQVYFMSLLQLVIASELTRSLMFGVFFILFMVLLVSAMVLSHFLKEGSLGKASIKRPIFFISIMTLCVTVFFFVLLPRTPHKVIGKSQKRKIMTVGFSERVNFGSFGMIKIDPTVVMRIKMDKDIAVSPYWRGISLDYFDGMAWRNTLKTKHRRSKRGDQFVISAYGRDEALEQKIYLEPIDSSVLFGLPEISAIEADVSTLMVDDAGGLYMPRRSSRRITYTVYSVVKDRYPGIRDVRYIQLPHGMKKITDLARRVTSRAETVHQIAELIEEFLRDNYTYSLNSPVPPEGASPVEDFLFNTKRGFCEHYATSMAMMLRVLGIPSRIVNGYYGGEFNEYGGYYIVRQRDAHSWVEAFIDGVWRRFDPTPSIPLQKSAQLSLSLDTIRLFWFQYVVGYSSFEQKEIMDRITAPFKPSRRSYMGIEEVVRTLIFIAAAMLFVFLVCFVLKKIRSKKYSFATQLYLVLRTHLQKKGVTVTPAMTPGEIKIASHGLSMHRDVEEFIALYEYQRFGMKELTPDMKDEYVRILKQIKEGLTHESSDSHPCSPTRGTKTHGV